MGRTQTKAPENKEEERDVCRKQSSNAMLLKKRKRKRKRKERTQMKDDRLLLH